MTKELIISANVYEKKVALIEEGIVTEFYVERRDENQGVVGNLYKGRVMKVLPGMQSAFVDIGLERDAFLYVSDFTEFLEEEDEVDFKDVGEGQQKAAEERGRRDRREREQPPQRAPRRGDERAADERGGDERRGARKEETQEEVVEAEEVVVADVIEQLAEIAAESIIPQPSAEEETEVADAEDEGAAVPAIEEADVTAKSFGRVSYRERHAQTAPVFERIADDDLLPAATTPDVEEAVVEAAPMPLVSEEVSGEAATDGEGHEEEKPKRGRSRRKAAGAATPAPAAEPAGKSSRRGKKPEKVAPAAEAAEAVEAVEETAKKSGRSAKGAAKRPARKRKGEDEAAADTTAPQFERIVDEFAGGVQEAKETAKKAGRKETASEAKPAFQPEPEPEWRIGSFRSQGGGEAGFQRVADETAEESATEEKSAHQPLTTDEIQERSVAEPPAGDAAADDFATDREASVRESSYREEFAVRRGGRGRRRPPRRDAKGAPASAPPSGEAEGEEDAGAAKAEAPAEKPEPRPVERRSEAPRRERGGPPTISDLLREGQEVLVQIAKEPIAKKGARITSHIALPGRFLVYMPTVNHIGVSRKIPSDAERVRLKRLVTALRDREAAPGGFIARTACAGTTEQELHDDMRYLIRTWNDIRKKADRAKPPSLVHRDLDLIQRILRDQLADDFSVIRVDNEIEYARIVEFVNRVQPRLVNRVKLYTGSQPIFEKYNVQPEVDKAVKPRVWLKSGGYIVINQTEALVAIDVNTGKFVGKSDKLEDTITRTNLEAAREIVRQIRLRDLGGIIVVDFIDMEERKNRQKVMQTLQEALMQDRSPSKILSINDFGLLAITRKRVKQSLERTLCTPCPYCQGSALVKSAQTMCFEILEQAKAISPQVAGASDVLLRVSPVVAEALHTTEKEVFEEIEAYFGTPVTIEADYNLHQEQFDFAIA